MLVLLMTVNFKRQCHRLQKYFSMESLSAPAWNNLANGGKSFSCLGQVRDEKGRKMSKSLGNVVDPVDVIANNSCDALRLTLATGLCFLPDFS